MEKRIAYCEHCGRNTTVVDIRPQKWFIKNMFWIVLCCICLPLIGVILICIMWQMPSDNLYCEKCASFVGTKTDAKPRCGHCQKELEPGMTFCPHCGKKFKQLKDSIICKKCKTENSPESTYCEKCGAQIQTHKKHTQTKEPVYGWTYWE